MVSFKLLHAANTRPYFLVWRILFFLLIALSLLLNMVTTVRAARLAEIGPAVTGISSTVSDGMYGFSMPIPITVTFDIPVAVTGTPQLTLETGATDRVINYATGSGTTTLTFMYTVQTGDYALDLDYTDRFALTLNGGTIQDASTSDPADLLLPVPGTPGSLGANKNIIIDDGNIPTVVNITSTVVNGTYGLDRLIPITVSFSEAVVVIGTPQLTLETGATDQVVDYSSGSGTNTLIFNYTVQTGDTSADLDYLDANALALNGGAIQDGVANNAIITLPMPGASGSLGANKDIVIIWDAAVVTGVASTNGAYGAGALIPITVTFSEAVVVTATPQLTLETGVTDRVATYNTGSGTDTLTFNYTVQAGDESPDLDYVDANALALNGGTIQDPSATDVVLTLPTPGGSGSLGANNAITVDAVAPVTSIESTPANPTSATDATFTFSAIDNISIEDSLTFECRLDGGLFSVCANPQNYTGLSDGSHTFDVQAVDALSNTDPTPDSYTWVVDTVVPTGTMTSTAINPTNVSPIPVTVQFSETVSGFVQNDIVPTNATVGGFAMLDGDTYSFDLIPTVQGTVSALIPAGSFADEGGLNFSTVNITFSHVYATSPVITEGANVDVTMSEDSSPTAFSLTLNATEANGDPLTWSISSPASFGTAGAAAGPANSSAISYTPLPNYNGSDTFVVQVSDGALTDSITVNVTIEAVGDRPNLIWNQNYIIQYDTWLGSTDVNALAVASGYRKARSGTFTFKPPAAFTSFTWVSYRGPDQGKAGVYVDGVLKKTVDLYRATAQWQYPVVITGLTNAKHTVIIKPLNTKNAASSNRWVVVDGFKVNTKTYDDDYIGISGLYSYGSWLGLRDPGSHFGAYRQSSTQNASMKFTFDGVQFNWVTARGPGYGKAQIWVDGVLKRTVDLYRSSQQWQYEVAVTGLTYGNHTVEIRVLGTKNAKSTGFGVVSDGFEIE